MDGAIAAVMGEKLPTYVVEVGLKEVQDDTSVDAVALRAELHATLRYSCRCG